MAVLESPTQPTHLAEVDANSNLLVNLPVNSANAGCVRVLDGEGNVMLVSANNSLQVTEGNMILWDQIDGTAPNLNLWSPSVSGMTIAIASGFTTLNSGSATTASAYASLSSNKFVPLFANLPTHVTINAKVVNAPQLNATIEIGIGAVSGASAPTDGAFFRWNGAGQFVCVINNNGSETSSASLTGVVSGGQNETVTLPPIVNATHLFEIEIVENTVVFTIDDVQVASLVVPVGQAYPFNNGSQQIVARVYNGGSAPSTAPQLMLGQLVVVQKDQNQQCAWEDTLAKMGRGLYQSPITPFAATANFTNSVNPVSAALSNTAAGYTTLGGRFQFAAVVGAVTDFALFGFQVPTGMQLILTGIAISSVNTGAAAGVTGTILEWGLGINSSGVSLATADGAGTWAPRRIPIGMQAVAALAAIGSQPPDLIRHFDTPIVVDSGRFLHVILQVPIGLATASQVIRGTVMLNGYFE